MICKQHKHSYLAQIMAIEITKTDISNHKYLEGQDQKLNIPSKS